MSCRAKSCGLRTADSNLRPLVRSPKSAARSRSAFTLIELLVVILVLGLLAGLVGPQILDRVGGAKSATARTQIELLDTALESYRLDNGMYPTTEQGLDALRAAPSRDPVPTNWRGPYLRKPVPLDPWGQPYVYRSPGEIDSSGFDLLSHGRDGRPGGDNEDADVGTPPQSAAP